MQFCMKQTHPVDYKGKKIKEVVEVEEKYIHTDV